MPAPIGVSPEMPGGGTHRARSAVGLAGSWLIFVTSLVGFVFSRAPNIYCRKRPLPRARLCGPLPAAAHSPPLSIGGAATARENGLFARRY